MEINVHQIVNADRVRLHDGRARQQLIHHGISKNSSDKGALESDRGLGTN
jgi:hypothetical protein